MLPLAWKFWLELWLEFWQEFLQVFGLQFSRPPTTNTNTILHWLT
jgi:hypothetical protein